MVKQCSFVLGLAVAASALGACATPEQEDAASDLPVTEAYVSPDTPVIRPDSLMAFDVFPEGKFVRVDLDAERGRPASTAKNWDWGDQGVHTPSNSGNAAELEQTLSPGYVLTGFGARVGNGAFTRMRLRQIGINNDWSWDAVGSTWRDWARGPGDDGGTQAELELILEKPYVAVGIGLGITNQNLRMIQIRKREYSPAWHQLIKSEYDDVAGWGGAELYWDTSYVTQSAAQKAKMVLVGLGVRENSDNVATLRVWAAYLD